MTEARDVKISDLDLPLYDRAISVKLGDTVLEIFFENKKGETRFDKDNGQMIDESKSLYLLMINSTLCDIFQQFDWKSKYSVTHNDGNLLTAYFLGMVSILRSLKPDTAAIGLFIQDDESEAVDTRIAIPEFQTKAFGYVEGIEVVDPTFPEENGVDHLLTKFEIQTENAQPTSFVYFNSQTGIPIEDFINKLEA